jgi:hypothetical protein
MKVNKKIMITLVVFLCVSFGLFMITDNGLIIGGAGIILFMAMMSWVDNCEKEEIKETINEYMVIYEKSHSIEESELKRKELELEYVVIR